MTLRKHLLGTLCGAAAASLGLVGAAHATVVATIVGAYDFHIFDSPELDITNSSGGTLTNLSMHLTGYQAGTLNFGDTETVALPDIADGATAFEDWGAIPGAPSSTTPNNLSAYDYDDEWGNTPSGYTNPNCIVTGSLCSLVGNFSVVLTGTISGGAFDGDPVFAVFSPTSNFTGGFVGWEGLDPTGLSETTFDEHSGSFSGTMAVIQIGTPPIPEPSTWTLMLAGMGGLGYALRRAGRRTAAA
jgi:hypothetical protein